MLQNAVTATLSVVLSKCTCILIYICRHCHLMNYIQFSTLYSVALNHFLEVSTKGRPTLAGQMMHKPSCSIWISYHMHPWGPKKRFN